MQVTTEERTRELPRPGAAPATRPRARRSERAVDPSGRRHEPSTPRLQAAVRNAYAMAKLMKVERAARVRTAVLREDGTVLAVAVLRGMEPAGLVRDLLVPLGFREVQATHEHSARGYGMVLQFSRDSGEARALHSGGAPVLWPPLP
jgi:hypothetical protein